MNLDIVFLKPILSYKKWGANDFKSYGIQIDEVAAGELILLSDSGKYINSITNSRNSISKLHHYYISNKRMFNSITGSIPYTIKIINPASNMGIYFSPNNYYTKYTPNKFGQKKLWISLPNDENKNYILYGSHCKTKQDVNEMILNFDYDNFGHIVELKPYEAVKIDNHTINTIFPNSHIYEISFKNFLENEISDVDDYDPDYFDYMKNAILTNNNNPNILKCDPKTNKLIDDGFFRVKIFEHIGCQSITFKQCKFVHIFIIEGVGKINNFNISVGSNFLVRNNVEVTISGNLKYITTYINDMVI